MEFRKPNPLAKTPGYKAGHKEGGSVKSGKKSGVSNEDLKKMGRNLAKVKAQG